MDFSFRGHQFLAHWIPGFVLLCTLYVCDRHFKFGCYDRIESLLTVRPFLMRSKPEPPRFTTADNNLNSATGPENEPTEPQKQSGHESGTLPEETFTLLLFVTVVFVLGQFIDALRDICEDCGLPFGKGRIDWKKIPEMDSDERQAWDDYFFSYYIFAANIALGGLLGILFFCACKLLCPNYLALGLLGFILMIVVFWRDAWILRKDVQLILKKSANHTTPTPTVEPPPRQQE